jgi:hypothetical protein
VLREAPAITLFLYYSSRLSSLHSHLTSMPLPFGLVYLILLPGSAVWRSALRLLGPLDPLPFGVSRRIPKSFFSLCCKDLRRILRPSTVSPIDVWRDR